MSNVSEILSFIESSVELVLPIVKKSQNYYNFENNADSKNGYIYAVRPGSASPGNGVTKQATITQDFELQLARDYFDRPSDDLKLREVVNMIYADSELVLKELSLRKNSSILIIQPPSFDAPEVNEKSKSVSITFTFPITYRKSLKGAP